MPVFNRSEQLVFLLLATALVVGAAVRITDHYFTDLPDFHVIRGAVTPPPVEAAGAPLAGEATVATNAAVTGRPKDDPMREQAAPMPGPKGVDVNTADAPELITLPGIGPRTAERILDDRAANGPYRNVDALTRVKGIGPRTLERMRPHIRIEAASTETAP